MSEAESGSEATAAALVGSLSTFTLIDVLDLLARTGHTGELQVVGHGVDDHLFVEDGDLVDASGNGGLEELLFDLACRDDGWFYFSTVTSLPEGAERLSVSTALSDIGPQVEEFRTLSSALPFDGTVRMSSSTPAGEIQIRADQWQMLSAIGTNGLTVREVVDANSGSTLENLRTIQGLVDAGLVELEEASASPATTDEVTEAAGTGSDLPEPPLPPFSSTSGTDGGPPAAPEGWVSGNGDSEAEEGDGAKKGKRSGAEVMPPPISGDPWSSSV